MNGVKKEIWTSLWINTVIVVFVSLISYPKYESEIDIMMQSVLYGIKDADVGVRLVFSNNLIGNVLSTLIHIASYIPWYTIFHYACIYVSLIIVGYLFFTKNSYTYGKIIFSIFALFIGYNSYIKIGYIKTSAIVCIASVYLILTFLQSGKKRLYQTVLIVIGLTMSSLISWTGFTVSFCVSLVYIFIYLGKQGLKSVVNRQFLITVLISGICILGVRTLDNLGYTSDEQWDLAYKYRNEIEKIMVFGAPEYSDDIYEKTKLDELQYNQLISGIYVSQEERGLELIESCAHTYKELSAGNVLKFLRTIPIRLFKNGIFYCAVILWVFALIQKKKKFLTMFLGVISIFLCSYFIFYMLNAWESQFIEAILIYPLCMLGLFINQEILIHDKEFYSICLMIFGVTLYINFSDQLVINVENKEMVYIIDSKIEREAEIYAIDLTNILKSYSAYVSYTPKLLERENLKLVNGNYMIFPEYYGMVRYKKSELNKDILWVGETRDIREIVVE